MRPSRDRRDAGPRCSRSENYPGQIVSDLFDEDRYFADSDLFWKQENEAIAAILEEAASSRVCCLPSNR